jgi:3-mercaptopyruvate sulfurtransferase SseA
MKKLSSAMAALALVAGLSGCSSSDSSDISTLPDSYDAKTSGIISAKTLASYIEDWENNRPDGVTGRLIIFQAGATSDNKFLKHDDKNVLVYQIPEGGACDPSYMRHDGMSNIPGALLDGPHVDGMINMFGIDPQKDYIVFAVGKGATTMREVVRSWWVLAYWGWSDSRLAFLNGSVTYTFSESSGLSNYLTDSATPPLDESEYTKYSMRSTNNLRDELQIYMGEMMQIASMEDQSGYFIADARGTDEYTGTKYSRSADKNCGPNHDEQCYVPMQGHIRGAVDFPYTDLLIMDDQTEDLTGDGIIDKNDASFKFRSPAALAEIYAEKGYEKGDKIITYCRTGRKATVTAITAYAALDYPVAMYDGSWIQWGEMADRTDVKGNMIVPNESRLNLNTSLYTVITDYVDPLYTQSATPYQINPDANTSDRIKEEDIAYMQQ